jgi:hypothetical protein
MKCNNSLTGSLSSSSVNAALSSAYFTVNHGPEKLSLSSADSSSSAPNSPPPNYDEVFDSSSASNAFNFSNQSNSNCFDNKIYFQRNCSQQLSASMTNLRNNDENQQQLQQILQQQVNNQKYTSENLPESNSYLRPLLKQNKNQFSVFSFPEFSMQNEEVKMSSRKNSTDLLSVNNMNLSPLLVTDSKIGKSSSSTFNMLSPPPLVPPPPPPLPSMPSHFSQSKTNSQLSLNSPAPPHYPPPPPLKIASINGITSNTPPPIPARPKK